MKTPLRLSLPLAATLAAAALGVCAQSTERPRPPGTTPLQEAPPPPPMGDAAAAKDPTLEPSITTRTEDGQTVQEYRVRGKVYMRKVTPKNGRPYVLMDDRGDGTFTRLDNDLDKLRVPQWVLREF